MKEPEPITEGYGSYDPMRRRRGKRAGRERGCWIYIPAGELERTFQAEDDAPPWYRVWGRGRGRIVVQLYRKGP